MPDCWASLIQRSSLRLLPARNKPRNRIAGARMAANSCDATLSASTFAACLAVSIFRGRTHNAAATNGEIVRFVSGSTSIVPVGRWSVSSVPGLPHVATVTGAGPDASRIPNSHRPPQPVGQPALLPACHAFRGFVLPHAHPAEDVGHPERTRQPAPVEDVATGIALAPGPVVVGRHRIAE